MKIQLAIAAAPSKHLCSFVSGQTGLPRKRYSGLSMETPKYAYCVRVIENSDRTFLMLNGSYVDKFSAKSAPKELMAKFTLVESMLREYVTARDAERNTLYWKIKEELK